MSLKLALTIDVEEEGLFSKEYEPRNVPVRNVPELNRLDAMFRELDIRPTLLVTYQVVRHEPYRELLLRLRDRWCGEIGAHLHPWNTPPLMSLPHPEPVPSELMPLSLLRAKIQTLFDGLGSMGVTPASFRMGRFNLGPKVFSILELTSIRVDSSIAPMRKYYGGPDHIAAPVDPYFPNPADPRTMGGAGIVEAPMTIVPLTRRLGSVLEALHTNASIPTEWLSWFAMHLGSLPAQPFWTGLHRLKAAVRLHRSRGGRVLTVFFHSSELLPGGCPQHKTRTDVDRFLEKLRSFLSWLRTKATVESFTLSELGDWYRCQVADEADRDGTGTGR